MMMAGTAASGRSAREPRERSAIWPPLFLEEPNRASERVGETEGRSPLVEKDVRVIFAAAFLRAATVSLVGVTLAIYLADIGFSATRIGLLIGLGLAGSSLATVIVSLRGDVWGRRQTLITLTIMTAAGYCALALFTSATAHSRSFSRRSCATSISSSASRAWATTRTGPTAGRAACIAIIGRAIHSANSARRPRLGRHYSKR